MRRCGTRPPSAAPAAAARRTGCSSGCGLVPDDGSARCVRRDLLEQFQPFSAQAVLELHEAGGISSRLGQAFDKPSADRISNGRENDRHRASCLCQFSHHGAASRNNDIWLSCEQFRNAPTNVVSGGSWLVDVERDVAALDPRGEVPTTPVVFQAKDTRKKAGSSHFIANWNDRVV